VIVSRSAPVNWMASLAPTRGLERDHRLGSSLERGIASDLEVADHLDSAVTELGFAVGITRQDGACGGLGIDRVGLAMPAAKLPVDPTDFDDAQTHGSESPRQAGTVGAGPFDTECMHNTVLGRPSRHLAIALAGYRERCGGKPCAQSVDRNYDVNVFVRVDANDDGVRCDIIHTGPPGGGNPKSICKRTGL
jgi:hypothetical protein